MQNIQVRHTEPRDIEAVKAIYAFPNAYAGTLQLPYPSGMTWEKRLTNIPDNVYSLVAEMDNVVVGNLGLVVEPNPRRRHCANFGMGVRDDYQGQGVGSALMTAILDLADNWLNLHRIELTVYTDNVGAIALYEKFGFVTEGELVDFAFRNGEYVNAYQMARLNPRSHRQTED